MINILFIAFEFPPLSRGGVHRPLAFVKYLPDFGINPVVITLDPGSYPDVFDTYGFDESLGKEVREKAELIAVKSGNLPKKNRIRNFLSIYFTIHGSETSQWTENFEESVAAAVRKYQPKALFATVPPFSVLPLATKAAEKYNLPLILDFRDAWSQWRTVPYGTILHYWLTLQQERKYLRKADAVITTSTQTLNDFKALHPKIPAEKLYYVANGFDGALKTWKPVNPDQKEFTIGYVGSFYYSPQAREQMLQSRWKKRGHRILQFIPHKQDWLYRSPYFFFKTIQVLNTRFLDLGKRVKIKFAGKVPEWLRTMIGDFNLENQVNLLGEISHEESLAFQEKCDALLITSAKQMGSRDYSIAGKTFEYLQMQKPILAFVCEGAQKDILQQSGTALICDPDDTEKNQQSIKDFLEGRITLCPDLPFLEGLSRKHLTGKLADIIRQLT